MKIRCSWVPTGDELYAAYHDEEWGVPTHDDRQLCELLILEGAQAGLSWRTVLGRRAGYRRAFDDFDVQKISKYNETKVAQLLTDTGIIRNKLKIRSAIQNARVFVEIQKEYGSFAVYLWSWVDNKPIVHNWKKLAEVPATSELSERISADLKKRGMSFVGSTIIYAYLQSSGLINDHTQDCFRYEICKK